MLGTCDVFLVPPQFGGPSLAYNCFARSLRFLPNVAVHSSLTSQQSSGINRVVDEPIQNAVNTFPSLFFSGRRFGPSVYKDGMASEGYMPPVPLVPLHEAFFSNELECNFPDFFASQSPVECEDKGIFSAHYLLNFERRLVNLGGVVRLKPETRDSTRLVLPVNHTSPTLAPTQLFPDQRSIVISALWEVSRRGTRGYPARLTFLNINQVCPDWELLRAVGVNIPKMLHFDYQKRPVGLGALLDTSDILLDKDLRPRYGIKYERAIFDLDGTLIHEDKPIAEAYNFLQQNIEQGTAVSLLTRHTRNVEMTLRTAGINPGLFSDIQVVTPDTKKSSYVRPNSIFIDNEFLQRVDVASTSSVRSFDLDQIDFF